MKRHIHYILSPVFYFGVAASGRFFTSRGVSTWYPSLQKPWFTPPGALIGAVWTTMYILSAVSLILFVNRARGKPFFSLTILLYVVNGFVNALWSYIFFTKHLLGLAVVDAVLIAVTVALIMILVFPRSKASALLLLPYLVWVTFASYLTYAIARLN